MKEKLNSDMKIALITFITPASENIRGTSALPYHLMIEREEQIDIIIYSFNANKLSSEKIAEVEKELKVTIKQVPLPKWYLWMFKLHLLFLRVFLKYPFVNYIKLPQKYIKEINAQQPNLIWVMGEELSRIVKQFPDTQRIQIGPDTESLYYYRMMGRRFVIKKAFSYWKCALMYFRYVRMEREFCTDDNFTYLAVGEEDIQHLHQLNPDVNAKFLRHPHYEVKGTNKRISFHQPKIKLLIAGQYNIYMQQDADLLNNELRAKSKVLALHYTIMFLGKGWEKHVETLRTAGYEVEHIKFAPDYIEEICKHDIQITPISIGTGTKGKVLDALANGLLVIGTPYALENIAVKHGESCIEYKQPEDVIQWLTEISKNTSSFEKMAERGRENVLKYHDKKLIATKLFEKQ